MHADVFIYTSLRDSFPGQILEAQYFSLPVITLDLHGQSIMVNENNGIKCSVNIPDKTIIEIRDAILAK
jgi:glycosyltransferase involved in cell wall biosynthesis